MNMRINKYIASTGFCSRREAEKYILEGRVSVNGEILKDLSTIITDKDEVKIDKKPIRLETENIYIMLNKPEGYVTTAHEQFDRPSVLDLVNVGKRIYPVGRLDMYSEGLLILTNDGDLTNKITHPTKHITKTYEAVLKYAISDQQILKLQNGVDIGKYVTRKADVIRLNKNVIQITITEGKNRQVRRMCEAVDNKVLKLKRISIGKLLLGNLETGKYRMLNSSDLKKIFS